MSEFLSPNAVSCEDLILFRSTVTCRFIEVSPCNDWGIVDKCLVVILTLRHHGHCHINEIQSTNVDNINNLGDYINHFCHT